MSNYNLCRVGCVISVPGRKLFNVYLYLSLFVAHNTQSLPVLLNTLTVLRLAPGVLSDRATDASAPAARPASAGTGNGVSAAVGN